MIQQLIGKTLLGLMILFAANYYIQIKTHFGTPDLVKLIIEAAK